MSCVVINFSQAKLAIDARINKTQNDSWRPKTLKFVENLSYIVSDADIDPLHKATLLMAKAVDVLSHIGPLTNSVEEENIRAKQLLHSITVARLKSIEPSVRIISDPVMDANLNSI